MATQPQNSFDFSNFNNAVKDAGSGLKLCLAERLLIDVQTDLIKYKNPVCGNLMKVLDDINLIRITMKKQSEERKAKLEALKENTTKLADSMIKA